MSGNDGDDTYDVDDTGDDVNENANEGIDTVMSAVDYELSDNVENLILTGTSNNDGVGNALANVLTGNSGNNILDGEDGNDTLDGGAGNDTADFDGNSGNYTFTLNALGQLVVTSNVGTDGADTLIGIESFAFTDATLGLVVGTPGNELSTERRRRSGREPARARPGWQRYAQRREWHRCAPWRRRHRYVEWRHRQRRA